MIPDLPTPNFEEIRYAVLQRVRDRLGITFGTSMTETDTAAIRIQSIVRGYLARKRYVQLLFDAVIEEENSLRAKERIRCEQGLNLLESLRLKQEILDDDTIRRAQKLRKENAAIRIQRFYRLMSSWSDKSR
eukprot:TRINITY_DN20280_c0_g1::TRINITY_DN20280_c0_g1_i1::g.19704::m.19704 TRINITY_DN20280_c0_g1::TRINITY_DN20280_c0_g1_i1::g.19704  ORF type:complete len:132 (-),score=-2.68,IQ/PF00612.22/7.6e-07,IQ/PF00612.22/0.49 TRINITY_DN20280_c0_g1_i1:28-423(-)